MNESAGFWADAVKPILQKSSTQKTLINIGALVILCAVAASQSSVFLSWRNWENIAQQIAYIVIIATPFTLLMISGAFDLSVGSAMALAGTSAALIAHSTGSSELGITLGTLTGLVVGGVNAFLVVGMGINSFIATIGTQYTARGIALLISGGANVSSVPPTFTHFGNTSLFGVSILLPISIGIVVLFVLIQRGTTLGINSVAAGSNEDASFLAGVPVRKTRIILFALTGLAAGFAGALQASEFGLGAPTSSTGLEFEVIVAVVVGGTSLFGGRGRVLGTFLGALIVGVVFNGLNLARVPSYWQTVSLGIILIAAVGIDEFVNRPTMLWRIKRVWTRIRSTESAEVEGLALGRADPGLNPGAADREQGEES